MAVASTHHAKLADTAAAVNAIVARQRQRSRSIGGTWLHFRWCAGLLVGVVREVPLEPNDAEPAGRDERLARSGDGGLSVSSDGAERGFLPVDPKRRNAESILVRLVATLGVVAIGTVIGAILGASDVAGWINGLVVASTCVLLAAILWRSRRL